MISRREFCIGITIATASGLIGCGTQQTVSKYPANSSECVDLFRTFVDPAFGLENATALFDPVGEPYVLDRYNSKRFTYDGQKDPVSTLILEISDVSSGSMPSGDLKLSSITIKYAKPFTISLIELEQHLGPVKAYEREIAQRSAEIFTGAFTNVDPGSRGSGSSRSYEFYPKMPVIPGGMIVSLLVNCLADTSNLKKVTQLIYTRR